MRSFALPAFVVAFFSAAATAVSLRESRTCAVRYLSVALPASADDSFDGRSRSVRDEITSFTTLVRRATSSASMPRAAALRATSRTTPLPFAAGRFFTTSSIASRIVGADGFVLRAEAGLVAFAGRERWSSRATAPFPPRARSMAALTFFAAFLTASFFLLVLPAFSPDLSPAFLPGFLPAPFLPLSFSPAFFLPAFALPLAFLPAFFLPLPLPAFCLPLPFLPAFFFPAFFFPAFFFPAFFLPLFFLPLFFLPGVFLPAFVLPPPFSTKP
ncbi:hypothetical protein GCM10009559_42870 [Pseudonocardia zijingensis]|uniref:Uncharacterized protein n=1 Tax=Pseudonocardia zijingensis TaxID=153376 RepID=A0ABN1QN53_9PSEU